MTFYIPSLVSLVYNFPRHARPNSNHFVNKIIDRINKTKLYEKVKLLLASNVCSINHYIITTIFKIQTKLSNTFVLTAIKLDIAIMHPYATINVNLVVVVNVSTFIHYFVYI